MDLDLISSMLTSICSSKQASGRYVSLFPIILGGSKLTLKEICKLWMAFSGRTAAAVSIDDIVLSHGLHMLHVMSNPTLIFEKAEAALAWILDMALKICS